MTRRAGVVVGGDSIFLFSVFFRIFGLFPDIRSFSGYSVFFGLFFQSRARARGVSTGGVSDAMRGGATATDALDRGARASRVK